MKHRIPGVRGVYVVHLNGTTRELTSPGAPIALSLAWLTQNATVEGKGIVDSLEVASGAEGFVTAYFDQAGADKADVSCVIRVGEDRMALAGPVVVACFKAKSQSEATVLVAQYLTPAVPAPKGPVPHIHIHATWPTVQ